MIYLATRHDHKVESSCGYSDVKKKIHLAPPCNSLSVTSSSRGTTYASSNSVSRKLQGSLPLPSNRGEIPVASFVEAASPITHLLLVTGRVTASRDEFIVNSPSKNTTRVLGMSSLANSPSQSTTRLCLGPSLVSFPFSRHKFTLNSAFSGRFARYILSRQLKVNKKHQVWFRFAGNPIRFSLREFAIVTGLPCGKFPKKSRKNKKERMAETPYWPTLFGGTDVVTVLSVIRMLRKKTVVDKEIRIKYALLALVSSVLMPTNLKSKIPKEYVKMIKDLNQFLSFPWGRLAFDMLMTSIKERDEVTLCQNTFALKGFVHAMQLVMVEAVPALTEVVQEAGSSSSESDSDREDGDLHEKRNKRLKLSPGHARDVDHKCEVPVKCIIEDDSIHPVDNEYEDYSDEKTDQKIENGKKEDTKTGKKSASPETVSDSKVAMLLYDKMKPEISRFRETTKNLDATVKAATEEFASMESRVGTLVESKIKSMIESVMVPMIEQKLFQMKGDIIQSIETMITNQHQDPIINSKSQPSSVQDHYNSDPTSNDTENQ
ncbi:hypothetical protein F2Q68_00045850 [Brassica cretica]|uniref:DUF1985 domain-containing protein n=1 Tax=Brassica cretica TaxID=69181 RepID=A0A8S9LNZ0_BRACR|nr:hypothetical protein F2Q68_00045850 [Brassica cretica]